jgi:hypothetical protein
MSSLRIDRFLRGLRLVASILFLLACVAGVFAYFAQGGTDPQDFAEAFR